MQARRREQRRERHVRRTVRIVCEGRAEEYFVKHVRSIYLVRRGNLVLSTRIAHGGGGLNALRLAMAPRVRLGVDDVAIFIDTDTDWDDRQREIAKHKRIHVLESEPCLEAWLLAVAGHVSTGDSANRKRTFAERFGADAHDEYIYAQNFDKATLDAARGRVPVLNRLLELIGV